MCSDVCITDFNSDEDDDVARSSSEQVSDDDRRSGSGSLDSSSTSVLNLHRVHGFGEFVENHGWIQCQSRSYPNRIYYHNTHSGCDTWYRPLTRYANLPFNKRAYHKNEVSINELELMTVSEDEKKPDVSETVRNGSIIEASDIITRYYYTPQVDLTSDNVTDDTDDSCQSLDTFGCKKEKVGRNKIDLSNENDNASSGIDGSDEECSLLCATNFLETEFFVEDGEVSIVSPTHVSRVYGVPRMKKINKNELANKKRAYVSRDRGPRKIICNMYGVRTINYDLPEPSQVQGEMGLKMSTLSDSDSDASKSTTPSRRSKTMRPPDSEWRDIVKNLHQPLLSDPSSSPSSRSDTSSSTSQSTSSTSSCSTCSSSSTKSDTSEENVKHVLANDLNE